VLPSLIMSESSPHAAALMVTDLVDLDRYPLKDLDGEAGRAMVASLRAQLANDGTCRLPGFLRPAAVTALAAEAEALAPMAYRGPTESTPYFTKQDEKLGDDLPDDHPRRRRTARIVSQVAYDLIPEDTGIRRIYEWDGLLPFFAAVLGVERLYRFADPHQSLTISVMDEGGCQHWHFDSGDFVVTLLLQSPERGGIYEYAPKVRSDDDENYDAVRGILDGERSLVSTLDLEPGMLVIFQGRYSLHRVTPVAGARRRLQTVLSFDTRPGQVGLERDNIVLHGSRTASA
jgi:hypothetical protein